MRAGINSAAAGQKNAGLALGFTLPQTYRFVMLPMAFRLVVPPLTAPSSSTSSGTPPSARPSVLLETGRPGPASWSLHRAALRVLRCRDAVLLIINVTVMTHKFAQVASRFPAISRQ